MRSNGRRASDDERQTDSFDRQTGTHYTIDCPTAGCAVKQGEALIIGERWPLTHPVRAARLGDIMRSRNPIRWDMCDPLSSHEICLSSLPSRPSRPSRHAPGAVNSSEPGKWAAATPTAQQSDCTLVLALKDTDLCSLPLSGAVPQSCGSPFPTCLRSCDRAPTLPPKRFGRRNPTAALTRLPVDYDAVTCC